MLALPLLLALATATEPTAAAEPAAPAPVEAVQALQAGPAAPAPTEAVQAGPVRIIEAQPETPEPAAAVAPAEAPAAEAPATPFLLDGFLPVQRVVAGTTLRLGGSRGGFEYGVEPLARWHGAVAGVTVSGASKSRESVRTLGLVAGYGLSRGLYRGEALLGWGLASDRRDLAGAATSRSGHFRSVQLGLDRAVCGGEGWRATLGAGLWWRGTFGLSGSPASRDEVGGGLRLGIEAAL